MNKIGYLVCMVFLAGCAHTRPPVSTSFNYMNYLCKEGPFVSVPTYTGAIAGSPTMIITGPITFVADESHGEGRVAQDMMFAFCGPVMVGDLVGTPFLIIKKTFWDFPSWIFGRREEKSQQSPAGDVLKAAPEE